jgi:Flp pilus assembly protein TadD
MLGCVSISALVAIAAVPSAADLRARATEAYRAGRHQEACKPFDELTRALPGDGEAWSDLGLCLSRIGRKNEALKAERRAASSGSCSARLHSGHAQWTEEGLVLI